MEDILGFRRVKNRRNIAYPNNPSSIAPVEHCNELPIPKPPTEEVQSESEDDFMDTDESFKVVLENMEPHFPNQHELDELRPGSFQVEC